MIQAWIHLSLMSFGLKDNIEDCFLLLKNSGVITQFSEWINQLHDSIKFTFHHDASSVNFLDVTVFHTVDNKLTVRPYTKETDKNTCISPPFTQVICMIILKFFMVILEFNKNLFMHRWFSCQQILEVNHLKLPEGGLGLILIFFVSCSSSYVIYLILCECHKRYVGSSSHKIRVRKAEHRSWIRNANTDAPLVQYFLDHNHHPNKFMASSDFLSKQVNFLILKQYLLKWEAFGTCKF